MNRRDQKTDLIPIRPNPHLPPYRSTFDDADPDRAQLRPPRHSKGRRHHPHPEARLALLYRVQRGIRGGSMTYDDAVTQAQAGALIRHPGMSEGWVIAWSSRANGLFNINPYTGGDYLFTPRLSDRKRQDWIAVEPHRGGTPT